MISLYRNHVMKDNLLILIAGLPGTGKTTIARIFAAQYGAVHISSDELRHELGLMGHYSPAEKQRVYNELLKRAGNALKSGRNVVVDSTFSNISTRQAFIELAAACHVPVKWVEIRAKETTLRERLSHPRPDSEANFEIYEKIRDQFEPLPADSLVIWSDEDSPEAAAEKIAGSLK